MSDMPQIRWGGKRAKAVLVLVAALVFVFSPLWTDGFAGFDPELFPVPQDGPPVQPAGYAFGIWGLIYLWLVLHAGYGLARRADDAGWDGGRWPLFLSLGFGAGWIAIANVSPPLATVVIWLMLLGALVALFESPPHDRWLAQAPIGVYAGWLTAASWVSVGLMLGGYGVTGETVAALIALALATAFAVAIQWRLGRAPEYGLTVIWALVAVVIANVATAPAVAILAGAGIVAMTAVALRVGRKAG